MADIPIKSYFPFHRIKIANRIVTEKSVKATIEIKPHMGFKPVCRRCGHKSDSAHN